MNNNLRNYLYKMSLNTVDHRRQKICIKIIYLLSLLFEEKRRRRYHIFYIICVFKNTYVLQQIFV